MSKTGRAAVMTAAKKDLEIREYPLPERGVRDACWSKSPAAPSAVRISTPGRAGENRRVPIILGHEIVGKIVELGARASRWIPGNTPPEAWGTASPGPSWTTAGNVTTAGKRG